MQEKTRSKYAELRNSLLTARMKVPFEVYLVHGIPVINHCRYCSLQSSSGSFTWIFNIPDLVTYQRGSPRIHASLSRQYSLVIGTVLAVIVSFFVIAGITFVVFLLYPAICCGKQETEY